jgi:Concanavalin A-like lectin/glucanases superfamily
MPRILTSRPVKPLWPFTVNLDSPQAKNLVAWWSMMPPGGTSLQDNMLGPISGHQGHPGTLTSYSNTFSSGWSAGNGGGSSIALDGNLSYVIFPTTFFPSGNSPFTINAWIRWAGNGTNTNNFFLGYGLDAAGGNQCVIMVVSTNLFIWGFGSGTGNVSSTTTIATNTWYMTTAVYDGAHTFAYINGRLEGTTAYSAANVTLNGNNGVFGALGALFSASGNIVGPPKRLGTFNGRVEDVRVYNIALTPSRIWALYDPRSRWELRYPAGSKAYLLGTVVSDTSLSRRRHVKPAPLEPRPIYQW